MSLTASLKVVLSILQTGASDFAAAQSSQRPSYPIAYSDGAGAGAVNVQWSDRRTINASSNEDLDLAGSLANLLGAAVFARVKAILIVAADANPTDGVLRVTRPASAGVAFPNITAGDSIFPDIGPGGVRLLAEKTAAGVVVTATTADLINIANTSGTAAATYDIFVLGAAS